MEKRFNLTTSDNQISANITNIKKGGTGVKVIVAGLVIGTLLSFSPLNINAYAYNNNNYNYVTQLNQSDLAQIQVGTQVIVPSNTQTYQYSERTNKLKTNEKTEEPYNFGIYKVESVYNEKKGRFTKDDISRYTANTYVKLVNNYDKNDTLIVRLSTIIKYLGPTIKPLEYNLNYRIGSQVIIPSNVHYYFIKDGQILRSEKTTDEPYWQGESKITQIWAQGKHNVFKKDCVSQFEEQNTYFASIDIDGTGKNIKIFCLNDLLTFVPNNITKFDNVKPDYAPMTNDTDRQKINISPSIKVIKKEVNPNDKNHLGLLHIRWIDDNMQVHSATVYPDRLFGKKINPNSKIEIIGYSSSYNGRTFVFDAIQFRIDGKTYEVSVTSLQNAITAYSNPYKQKDIPNQKPQETPNSNDEIILEPGYHFGPDGNVYDKEGNLIPIIPSPVSIDSLKDLRNEVITIQIDGKVKQLAFGSKK